MNYNNEERGASARFISIHELSSFSAPSQRSYTSLLTDGGKLAKNETGSLISVHDWWEHDVTKDSNRPPQTGLSQFGIDDRPPSLT